MSEPKPDERFIGLVMSLHMSAWMQLGKVANPMTGKIDRDVQHAKETIDLLGTLEEKTRGNLHPEESKALTQLLYQLRMNYVEELEKDKEKPEEPAAKSEPSVASAENQEGEASHEPVAKSTGDTQAGSSAGNEKPDTPGSS